MGYAVGRFLRIPRHLDSSLRSEDSNCFPWSVVNRLGNPNRDFQFSQNVQLKQYNLSLEGLLPIDYIYQQ